MKIDIPVTNGYLPDKFGKHAADEFKRDGGPIRSFPITLTDVPAGTKTFAVTMIDHDAIPVGGFTWIHWVAANIDGSLTVIPENASLDPAIQMTYGKNSQGGHMVNNPDEALGTHYTGPMPPDKDHRYTTTVYALDDQLPLQDGFWLNELWDAMEGHVLAQATKVVLSRV